MNELKIIILLTLLSIGFCTVINILVKNIIKIIQYQSIIKVMKELEEDESININYWIKMDDKFVKTNPLLVGLSEMIKDIKSIVKYIVNKIKK